MFENRYETLLPYEQFVKRVVTYLTLGISFLLIVIGLGLLGFRVLEHMTWVDAFSNSAMTLADMGLITPLSTEGGKIFAGIYALFSGLLFYAAAGIIFAPIIHRLFHKFHLDKFTPFVTSENKDFSKMNRSELSNNTL